MARKYDNIEEELAIKSIELKDFKQKKMSVEVELKQEQDLLNNEVAYLSKDLKVTKD